MLTRRTLLAGGVVGSVATGAAGSDALHAHEAQSRGSNDADERLVKVVEEIRDLMRGAEGGNAPEVTQLRSMQKEFLKGRGKFPDFIEVGVDIWEAVINWHIRTHQQPMVTRSAEGRYMMALFQTNLVLRHDVSNSYVGQPFDGK